MDSPDRLRKKYQSLDSEYFAFRKEAKYPRAQDTLDEMLALISASPDVFDEAEDRMRILRARKFAVQREQARLTGSRAEGARLLREAAHWSTPSVCTNEPCTGFDPQLCVSRRPKLSTRQGRMCIEKIALVCEALKLEASVAAKRPDDPDLRTLLMKRQEAAESHRFALALDPSKQRSANQLYLDYWQAVTEGEVLLLEGHFEPAKQWFRKAVELGTRLHPVKCFPNFFRNVQELQAHDFFINAVSFVRDGNFREARNSFQTWLNLFPEHASSNDPRYDSIKIYELACDILDRLTTDSIQPNDWDRLSNFLEEANPALPAWALVKRLMELRAMQERSAPSVRELIPLLAQDWILFVPDSQLLGKDKTAGLGRRVNHPSFLNIFDRLDKDTHNWKAILTQNLKNLLLIMADYESKRYADPPDEESALPKLAMPLIPSEAMTIDRLSKITVQYLRRRSDKHAAIFEGALAQLTDFEIAINTNDFRQAVSIQKRIFEDVRFWPHTIQVLEQVEIPNYSFGDDRLVFSSTETVARRFWDREPRTITFKGADLRQGQFYYLRPKWNICFDQKRPIRHEQFHPSNVPKWINVFFDNLFERTKVDSKRFHDWIIGNFVDTERLLACRLFDMLKYYTQDDMRTMWFHLYRNHLPPEAKTRNVSYQGLGHAAKSGPFQNYYLRQAMEGLEPNELSFEPKDAFRDLANYQEGAKPHTVVFVDDFIGTGVQAVNTLTGYFKRYSWLNASTVYFCALVGFEEGMLAIKKAMAGQIRDIFVSEQLNAKDKAFSAMNPAWESEEVRKKTQDWAANIGRQVLVGRGADYDPDRDKLGWNNFQAMVAFHYNVPNNTLPIFWGTGECVFR